jgi:hypothetical protein
MKIRFFLLVMIAFAFAANVFAQSDLEKVQNFKSRFEQLEAAVKNATSLDECSAIADNIAKLKSDSAGEKGLLDKSLYPESYDSSFEKLERMLEIRKGDFTQITELTSEVGTLKDKVSTISQENQGLISQIRTLQVKSAKDAQTISSLQKLVAQLKANIQQRDELVRGIVDSLLTDFVKYPSDMNEVEKKNVFMKVDNGNLFYNIERTIADNVQFMKVTQMNADDLGEMKKQYKDFNKVWRQIGPKLADVYASRRDKAAQISNIDAMFTDWNMRLNDEMWGQVNKLFREKKVALLPFKSGDQFVNSVAAFVDDEIKNHGVKSSTESENVYYAFTDSVYFKTIEPVWIPVMIENSMMTEANKDSIDSHIAKWKEKVAPGSKMNWVYIGGGAVIVLLIIAYLLKGRKKPVKRIEDKEEDQL